MRQIFARVLAMPLIALAASAALADDPSPLTQAKSKIGWTVMTGIDHQVFPSATISTATSKHPFAYVVANVTNVPAGSKVHVTVKCDSLIEASSADVITTKDEPMLTVPIKVDWKFNELAHIHQQVPTNFTYSLTVDGQEIGEKTDTAITHSINDCIFQLRDGTGAWRPRFDLFAAYVNEDHPAIDKLLKQALATGVVKQFSGYQSKDPKQVVLQVFAVWHALQLKGIKYSNITDIPDKSDAVHAQHVRFLDESIGNAQANCVDGSILFASVLQKIGIESALVVVPHHMFALFYTEPNQKGPLALETTMMGQIDLPHDPRNSSLNLLDPKWRSNTSAVSFGAAVKRGAEEYAHLVEATKRLRDEHSTEFIGGIIPIADARKAGIMPIPYDSGKNP